MFASCKVCSDWPLPLRFRDIPISGTCASTWDAFTTFAGQVQLCKIHQVAISRHKQSWFCPALASEKGGWEKQRLFRISEAMVVKHVKTRATNWRKKIQSLDNFTLVFKLEHAQGRFLLKHSMFKRSNRFLDVLCFDVFWFFFKDEHANDGSMVAIWAHRDEMWKESWIMAACHQILNMRFFTHWSCWSSAWGQNFRLSHGPWAFLHTKLNQSLDRQGTEQDEIVALKALLERPSWIYVFDGVFFSEVSLVEL